MLTVRPKISELAFRLFGRSLHPELFEVFANRTIERKRYRFDVAITSSGHVITWSAADTQPGFQTNSQHSETVLTEVSSSCVQPVPTQRQLFCYPLSGKHEEELVWHDRVRYTNSFQLEPADPKRFAAIQNQLVESADYEGLIYQFHASGRIAFGGVSYIDIQSREREVKFRAFHTFPDAYIVAITESSFTLLD